MRLFNGCFLLWLTAAAAAAEPPGKSDLLIYDRPNWNSYTYNYPILGGVQIRDHDEIIIRFDTANAAKINDDFFVEEYLLDLLKFQNKVRNHLLPKLFQANVFLLVYQNNLVENLRPMFEYYLC